MSTVKLSRTELAQIRSVAKDQSARWGGNRRVTVEPGIRYNLETGCESINVREIDQTPNWEDSDLLTHADWGALKDPLPLGPGPVGECDLYVYSQDSLACNIQIEFDRGGLLAIHADAEKNVWHREGVAPFDAVAQKMGCAA